MISSARFKFLLSSSLCAATALFTSHGQAASQPESFSGMYNSITQSQYDGVAVYGSTNSGNFTSLTLPVFVSVAANTPTTFQPTTVQVPVGATNLRVSVFSVYGSATSLTVALVLDSSYALNITSGSSTAFATDFGGASEATVATYIQGAAGGNSTAATALEGFFNQFSADFPAVSNTNTATGTLVTFTNAAIAGSASLSLTPVPEPSTWVLCGVGVGLLAWRLRRRASV